MKIVVILLAVVCLALGFGLFQKGRSADAAESEAATRITALSNQLAEATLKVNHQEQLATVAQSALKGRDADLLQVSNRVQGVQSELKKARAETDEARSLLQERESSRDGIEGQLKAALIEAANATNRVHALETEAAELRSRISALETEGNVLANEMRGLRVTNNSLVLLFNDPKAMRDRLKYLPDNFGPLPRSSKVKLTLQPDGSVSQTEPAAK